MGRFGAGTGLLGIVISWITVWGGGCAAEMSGCCGEGNEASFLGFGGAVSLPPWKSQRKLSRLCAAFEGCNAAGKLRQRNSGPAEGGRGRGVRFPAPNTEAWLDLTGRKRLSCPASSLELEFPRRGS